VLSPEAVHDVILGAFDDFQILFRAIGKRAGRSWRDGDWAGMQFDARERLRAHRRAVDQTIAVLGPQFYGVATDEARSVWVDARHRFGRSIAARSDSELAETFFNSVTRRLFDLTEIDEDLEFRWFGGIELPQPDESEVKTYERSQSSRSLFKSLLEDLTLSRPFDDLDGDAGKIAIRVDEQLAQSWEPPFPVEVQVLKPVFFRNQGAYVVARIRHLDRVSPLVIALLRTSTGVRVDAVLLTENAVSRVFGFTRTYFHIDTARPAGIVGFVKSLIPTKPVAELYTALGLNQHGKTSLYRGLRRHLDHSSDLFEPARGTTGMVMVVFTLPSFDVVFKVIRDTFDAPKRTTPGEVRRKYQQVFEHDRVGRMVDAQEFEHLALPRARFGEELLDLLAEKAENRVEIADDLVILHHVYTERRVHPLNLYVREVDEDRARLAVTDYGEAIKDLAAANIFPGDLFMKNFGVTRHGTVVFYDYDEIALIEECNFRRVPEARNPEDEMSSQIWFSTSADDVFPEEFSKFFRFPLDLQSSFDATHRDLATLEYWASLQRQLGQGDPPVFFPYPHSARVPRT
jgi:isocitrate dehydrogenase kinase/phosphatase